MAWARVVPGGRGVWCSSFAVVLRTVGYTRLVGVEMGEGGGLQDMVSLFEGYEVYCRGYE